jgi:phosphoribosylglycinamide formyltransferase 1
MPNKFRIVILVSGRGSNMEAVIRSTKSGVLKDKAEVVLVLSDNPEAKALEIATGLGVQALYQDPGNFRTKLEGEAEQEYIRVIKEAKPSLVVLAGFMRIIKPSFIRAFHNKIINIHPSLLPKYPGLHTHERALAAGDGEAGCTVHFVNEVTDGGKRILQAKVKIETGDTGDTLAARVLEKEHVILPKVIGWFAEGKIEYDRLPDEPAQE